MPSRAPQRGDPSPSPGQAGKGVDFGTGWGVIWGGNGGEAGGAIAKARPGASLPGNVPQGAVGGYNPGRVPKTEEEAAAGRCRPEKSAAELGAGSPPPTWGTCTGEAGQSHREGEVSRVWLWSGMQPSLSLSLSSLLAPTGSHCVSTPLNSIALETTQR